MKLTDIVIQEEAPTGPVEIKDVAKFFPNTFDKAVKSLFKQGRLTFGGKKLDEHSIGHLDDLGVEHAMAQQVPVHVEVQGHHGGYDEDTDVNYDSDVTDTNPVYVGYDKRGDKMIVGIDAWLDDNGFDDEFEKEFEQTYGEDYNNDNPDHHQIYEKAWKDLQDQMFVGLAVEVRPDGTVDAYGEPMAGGFYKNKDELLHGANVVDLRLD